MIVLSLCKTFCPEKIPPNIGEYLSDGADGEVFDLLNDPNKIIKFCVLYEEEPNSLLKRFDNFNKTLDIIIDTIPAAYVRVYEKKYLGEYSRKMIDWRADSQQFIIHYYVMEKLNKLLDDEKKVFHTIISHEDRNFNKNYTTGKIKKMLKGMSCGLDFDIEKVMLFINEIKKTPIKHLDIHIRNIMRNNLGDFKLIDLDRIKMEKNNER